MKIFQISNKLVLTSLLMFDVNAQLNQSMEWFFRKPFPITGLVSKVLTFPKLRAASKLKLKTNNCPKLWTAALSVIKVAPARGIPMQHSMSSNINLLKWKNSKSFDYMCYRLCNFCDLSVSYLISLKYLLLENIAHDGFQHFFVCAWLCLGLPWSVSDQYIVVLSAQTGLDGMYLTLLTHVSNIKIAWKTISDTLSSHANEF